MTNPWTAVPLSDYEGHMGPQGVGQLLILADMFADVLERCHPESIAVLGIAGGNGLDRIDTSVTRRVVGIDINSTYLRAVQQRFGSVYPLELHCMDLATQSANLNAVQLVHAALVFEHAGTDKCLDNALALVAPEGSLSVILQLPSASEQNVGVTPYASIQTLSSHFRLIDPEHFRETLAKRGFVLEFESRRLAPGGKGFWSGVFRLPS